MSEKAPGFEEYTPSRLEWLAVVLNSYSSYISVPVDELLYSYTPAPDGKTLILKVSHCTDTSKSLVDSFTEQVKRFALNMIKNYGWDSWVKIETQFIPID